MYRLEIRASIDNELLCLLHGELEDIATLIELIGNHVSNIRFKISSL